MSGRWLYLALSLMIIVSIPHWLLFYGLLIIWQLKYRRLPITALIVLLIIGFITHQPKPNLLPQTKNGAVESIRNGYLIVDFDSVKAIVYTDEVLPKGTMISVNGKFQTLDNTASLYAFNFDSWCQARGITASINAKSLNILKPSSSIQRFFFQRLNNFDEELRNWCFKVFYGVREQDAFYLISASALHLSFIMQLIKKMTKSKTGAAAFLIFYGIFIHFSFAICRLLIFTAVRQVFPDSSSKDRLGIAMILTLLLFPYAVYELSFILPVSFTLLSIFSCHKISKLLSSWLVLMPVQLLSFYEFNLLSPLFFSFYRVWYSINLLLTLVCVLFPTHWLLIFLRMADQAVQQLQPTLFTLWGKPSTLALLIYLICVIAYISKASIKHAQWLLCGMLVLNFSPYLEPFTTITYINVGQGDSILITLPFHGGAMMIDAAGSLYTNIPERKILPVLKAKGYKTIDQLILTHADKDHAGGLQELADLVVIKQVITDKQAVMDYKNIEFISLLAENDFGNENDNSIVLLSRIGALDYLFTGDASQAFENQLLSVYPNIKCDVLKVGHHGSNSSSSALFLQTLRPQIAVISAGRNNRYGHPHDEVLARLADYQIKCFRTDLQGDIEIKSFLNFNFIITGSREFGIINKVIR